MGCGGHLAGFHSGLHSACCAPGCQPVVLSFHPRLLYGRSVIETIQASVTRACAAIQHCMHIIHVYSCIGKRSATHSSPSEYLGIVVLPILLLDEQVPSIIQ